MTKFSEDKGFAVGLFLNRSLEWVLKLIFIHLLARPLCHVWTFFVGVKKGFSQKGVTH